MTHPRYSIVRHYTITEWLEHEPVIRSAITATAQASASTEGWPPPSDTDTPTVITYRWEPDSPHTPTLCPLDMAEFVELRLEWADPEGDE